MNQLKKTGVLLFVLIAVQLMSVNAQNIYKQMKETNKMSITVYQQLIQFVLTKDTLYHTKAMKTIDDQEASYKDLKKMVENGSIYETLLSAYITTCSAYRTLYDTYFRNQIMSDNDKTKEFKYENQSYMITKYRQKKFDELLSLMKKEQNRNK